MVDDRALHRQHSAGRGLYTDVPGELAANARVQRATHGAQRFVDGTVLQQLPPSSGHPISQVLSHRLAQSSLFVAETLT